MSRRQRLTFLAIAALIGVTAIFVLADSSEDDPPPAEPSAATATPTPAATVPQELSPQEPPEPTPQPTPAPPPLLTTAKVTDLEYTEGETVRFRVRSSEPDEVHVHGYDLFADVVPGETTRMSFEADITGIFEIELEHSGKEIARLKVEPE
jgi:hypothetical protein